MIHAGVIWELCRGLLVESGKLEPGENLDVAKLSTINISRLRRELGTMTENEARFFDRFTRQKFFATHFTNADLDRASPHEGVLSMHSRRTLEKRNIPFDEEHSAPMDLYRKSDDDFVFFSLECGEQPKKLDSRFGQRLYRVPFDSPAFMQSSWGALDDLLAPQTKNLQRFLPWLSTAEASALSEACCRSEKRDYGDPSAYNDIFVGKELIPAAALSIISRLRKLKLRVPFEGRAWLSERLLASTTSEEINGLLNSIHRPEIRVPSHFFSSAYQSYSPKEISRMKAERNASITLGNASKGQVVAQGDYLWLRAKSGMIHEFDAHSLLDEVDPEALLDHVFEERITDAERPLGLDLFFAHVHKLFQETEQPRERLQTWLSDFARASGGLPSALMTPAIMVAASLNLTPALQDLLQAGGDVNDTLDDGTTPLMVAAKSNHLGTLHFLLDERANIEAKNADGSTPLMLAVLNGKLQALAALLDAGAKTETKNNHGETPLMHAASQSDIQALTILLCAGADPDATDAAGMTALALAALHGSVEAARFFTERGSDGVNELIAVTWIDDDEAATKAAEVLLQAGADGVRASLHLATSWHLTELRRLIQAGADKVTNARGRTALMEAVEMTSALGGDRARGLRALHALIRVGADKEIKDNNGKTARMHAADLVCSKGDDTALLVFQELERFEKGFAG